MRRREPCVMRGQSQKFQHRHAALPVAMLTTALLSACSVGATGHVSAGSAIPTASTAAVTAGDTAAASAPAVVVEHPSTAPTPVPIGRSVATDPPPPRTTDIVLSFLGWNAKSAAVEAGGYLSPVVETGGTCTLTLTRGPRTVTAVAAAQADASTTSCGDLAIPRARLTPGTWQAELRYASKTTTGTSDRMSVAVPQ